MSAQTITTPPQVLDMEEYRRSWEPEGWQLLTIGPTSTWREDWGVWEAIRDIVQNALDETEDYTWGYDDDGLYISDQGKGIGVADFLLGPPKLKALHARGKFGEGMKIAALTLVRMGHSVKVDTVGRELWIVFVRVRLNGEADQLAALWRHNGSVAGTVFHIIDYFGDAFADRFAVNISPENILSLCPSTLALPIHRFNQLIADPPGRIYARDIYMRDIGSPFSYNLWGFEMAPDRHAPKDEAEVWTDIGRVWATVTRVDLMERFLHMVKTPADEETAESHHVNMAVRDMGEEPVSGERYADFMIPNAAAWDEAWRRVMGEDAILRTSDRWDATVKHLGYKPVSVNWSVSNTLGRVLRSDGLLVLESQERLREVQVFPDEKLTDRQRVHLALARKIATIDLIPPLAGVHAAIIPPASDRLRTAGLYGRSTKEIFLAVDQLETARRTVDTMIHEIAHHTSQAEDGAPEHNAAMTRVAAWVMESTARGEFAEELKGVSW